MKSIDATDAAAVSRPANAKHYLAIALAIAAWAQSLYLIRTFAPGSYFDFDLYYFGGLIERSGSYTNTGAVVTEALLAGRHVSLAGVYGSPQFVALFFQPIAYLALGHAHFLWDAICVAAVTLAVRKAAGTNWGIWAALVFTSYSYTFATTLANASVLTFALITYCFGALKQQQSNRAGIALGIAIAFKLYPAFLLVALIANRQWRALFATLSTVAVLSVLTVPALGLHDTLLAIQTQAQVASTVANNVSNIGVPALVLDATNSTIAAKIAGLLVLASGVLFLLRRPSRLPERSFAAAAVFMLLGQTISWNQYNLIFLTTALTLTRSNSRLLSAGGAAGFFLACLPGGELSFLGPDRIMSFIRIAEFAGAFILLTTVVLAILGEKRPLFGNGEAST